MPPGKRTSLQALEAEQLRLEQQQQQKSVGPAAQGDAENRGDNGNLDDLDGSVVDLAADKGSAAEDAAAAPSVDLLSVSVVSKKTQQAQQQPKRQAAEKKKGGRPAKRARTQPTVSRSVSDSSAATAKLQAKYDALRVLRETEVEQMYRTHREECKQRDQASQALITQLRADNARLQAELAATSSRQRAEAESALDAGTKAQLDADIAQLETHLEVAVERVNQLNGQETLLKFLQQLTNTTLRAVEHDASHNGRKSYLLEVAGARDPSLRASFELTYAGDEVECMWVPTSGLDALTSGAIKEALPSALTDGAICFEPKEMPKFFKAVWGVMKDLKTSEL